MNHDKLRKTLDEAKDEPASLRSIQELLRTLLEHEAEKEEEKSGATTGTRQDG